MSGSARLDEQVRRLSAERDRIAGGGEIEVASDDRILEEYLNLRDLIAQLPADFLRVSEAVKAIQRVIAGEFGPRDVPLARCSTCT